MKYSFGLFFLITFFFAEAQRNKFPNVLDVRTHITDTSNVATSFFSDLGAWHAYALPERKEDYGSFIGPLLMDIDGKWLGNDFSKLQISESGREIDLTSSTVKLDYYPGLLQQEYITANLKVLIQIIFVSNRTASLKTSIINLSGTERKLKLKWTGKSLLSATRLGVSSNRVTIRFINNEHLFSIQYETKKKLSITNDGDSYAAELNDVMIAPAKRFEILQTQRYYLNSKEQSAIHQHVDFATEFSKNENRWNDYIKSFFSKTGSELKDETDKSLAVKSIITLITNWRSATKDLLSDGVFPSASYQGFYGFWSWDSWKQAVGLSYFHPQLAKSNIYSLFDYQDKAGMIPDCIYTEKKENNWRNTKPPLAGWAIWKVYEQTGDLAFLKKLYPRLVKYHEWWYRNRDHDENGLCEYGSTDGTRIAAAWESGMDNAVRFDDAVMLKNSDRAWSLNQESVDLNVYLYAEKNYLSKIAHALGKRRKAVNWNTSATALQQLIQTNFYHAEKGFFYDKMIGQNEPVAVEGPEAWIALWAGLANRQQAEKVADIMQHEKKFNTMIPLPTLTAGHPKFDPANGYWRGPVWLDQFYFGVDGLKQYGLNDLANEFIQKLFSNAEGLKDGKPIYENYHPLTGKGLNAINFSWSAAHLLMLLAGK
mgnify:CR=1 FL=1